MPDDPTKAKAEETAAGAGNQVTEGEAEGAGTQTAKTEAAEKFTPEQQAAITAEVTRVIAKARREERERVEKELEEAQAKEQGKFQQLYEELKPKHQALAAEAEQYRETVNSLAVAELSALHEDVREMSPAKYDGKTLINPLDVLAWLPKGKKLAEKLDGQQARPGAGADPKPKGAPGDGKSDEKARSAQASYVRANF